MRGDREKTYKFGGGELGKKHTNWGGARKKDIQVLPVVASTLFLLVPFHFSGAFVAYVCEGRGGGVGHDSLVVHWQPLCLLELPLGLEDRFEDFEYTEQKILYPDHIPTTWFQKGLLAVGSGLAAFFDPKRDG